MQNKTCSKCKITKDTSGFYKDSHCSDNLHPSCKQCGADLRANNGNKYAKKWRQLHPAERKISSRKSQFKSLYGITIDGFDLMYNKQDGKCACCGKDNGSRRLAVDHDHSTGKVRGLLCSKCNTAIGLCNDNPAILDVIAKYIRNN